MNETQRRERITEVWLAEQAGPPSLEERVEQLEAEMAQMRELLNCTRRTVSELRQGLNWDV